MAHAFGLGRSGGATWQRIGGMVLTMLALVGACAAAVLSCGGACPA